MKPKIKSIKSDHKALASKAGKKFSKRITTDKNWNDLSTDETTRQQLNDINTWIGDVNTEDRIAGRNTEVNIGYKVLFLGPPGSGKKLAAKLLGKQNNLDVYRVNLSKIVSKYIGETEKNLREVFDTADETHAILVFDESDELFGKRTQVQDAHDKYKTQEISCLLTLVKKYPGLVIFSSKNYDSGNNFTQHLNAVIHFKKLS